MFQRLVISIYAVYVLCSYVSDGYIVSNPAGCESDVEQKLSQCRSDVLGDEVSEFLNDYTATGMELITYMSTICSVIPTVRDCTISVMQECPSYNDLRRLISLERTSGLCNGSVPVNWLRQALLTMNDVDLGCLDEYTSPIFRMCAINWRGQPARGENVDYEDRISFTFRCMRTEFPAVTSIQTVCGTSVREILLTKLTFYAESLVAPSDEEINMIRTGFGQ